MTWWNDLPKAHPLDAALQAEGAGNVLAQLAKSVYQQETGSGKNVAVSTAGARGHMQVMPATFKEVADKGWTIDDPIDNMRAGIRYLDKMLKRSGGDPELAAVGYYSGPDGMDAARRGEARRDPTNAKAPTSLEYGRQVASRMGKTQAPAKAEWWQDYPEVTQADKTPSRPAGEAPAPSRTVKPEGTWNEEQPGIGAQLARQAGLTARHAISGAAALPAMLSDAVTGPINAGLDLVRGEGKGFRFQRAGQALGNVLTAAGLPEPANATERVIGDVAQGMAGAGAMVGAGKVLATAAEPVARGVGNVLAQGPGLQVASAATGTGASGITRESGGGAGAQVAAGLAGALAPSLLRAAGGALARGALRGGEAGRQAVADRVAAFEAAGVQPTVGQATGGRVARATESMLGKVPGGAGRMSAFAQKQADDLAASVQSLSDELAPNASAVNAGEAIRRGVNAFRDGVQTVQQKLYAQLDQHIPANTPVSVDSTRAALGELVADVPGAPGLSSMFKNAKIEGIHKAMIADLDEAAKTGGAAMLPYESLKKLRTLVGKELSDNRLVNDVPRAAWARLYGALSDDLGVAATNAGPEAQQAWNWANTFTRTQMQRLDELQTIVSRDTPERVFRAVLQGTSEGDTVAQRVISALPMRERREVAGAVLQRLGRATPGQQNAAGDAFSSETFLTNLARMSEPARKTLLGRTDLDGLLDKIGQFASVADVRREAGRVFANPSGTAPAAAQIGVGSAIAGGAAAAVAGNPVPLAGALAIPAAANLGARAMTSQSLVNMAATPTTLAPGAQAAVLGAAGRVDAGEQPQQPMPGALPMVPGSVPGDALDPADLVRGAPLQVPQVESDSTLAGVAGVESDSTLTPAMPRVESDSTFAPDAFARLADAQTVGEAIAAMQPRRQPRPEQPQVVQTLPQPTQAPAMPPRLSDAQRLAQQRAGAQALRSHAEQLAAARGPDIITAAAPLSSDDLTRIINNRTLPERARVHALAERARRRRAAVAT